MSDFAQIPMQFVGPMKVSGSVLEGDYEVPLATYEAPLWPSVNRGARVSMQCKGGIQCTVVDDRMTRSVLLEVPDASVALQSLEKIKAGFPALCNIVEGTSRFARLIDMHSQIAGNLLFLRFEFTTGDAAGHNMCTQAAEALMNHILEYHPELKYGSISGNYCSDKKATAVNGILGRGKYVVAEITIPRKICSRNLKTAPEKIVQLNIRKNLIGT
ncbi:MAG: hydroxymethylglutaryl-CoA reductase, partial [Verrucomicrobia bacterium]|nr:hydroxymethylglutaryl-CoA reductase [Verrucomicrobiota bacterium]